MIVALAGLPGTGKSTLARALAARCYGAVVSKDAIRAAMFPPPWTSYSAAQDDFVMSVMLRAAAWLAREQRCPAVFLDGRTFSRAAQRHAVLEAARALARPFHVVECVCADATAIQRIREDASHPAANRDEALFWRMKSAFEPVADPLIRIDTDQPLAVCVDACARALAFPKSGDPVAE